MVTKGQRAGDSAGLFLSLGRRPRVGLRGRNLSSLRVEPLRAAPAFGPLVPWRGILAPAPSPTQSPVSALPGGRPNTRFMVNAEPRLNSTRPNISTPP